VLPGPDRVERKLGQGKVGWLVRGEPRGEPYAWPGAKSEPMRFQHSRVFAAKPGSPFRIALAYARGTEWFTKGAWYCLNYLAPLVDWLISACTRPRALHGGVAYYGSLGGASDQFPVWVGFVADEVESIELYHEDGAVRRIPIVNNAFAFQTSVRRPVKLVARDAAGRVVKVGAVGSPESGLRGMGAPA
jgi:hypothetical protein